MNKLRAYELQDGGADTVEANEQLGFKADLRIYEMPGAILKHTWRQLGCDCCRTIPRKSRLWKGPASQVVERVPCIVEPIASTEVYLRTKKEKMGHLLGEM